jgi:Ring finger domain
MRFTFTKIFSTPSSISFSPFVFNLQFAIYFILFLFQVCCICLAKYADNDELLELTCAHCFHKECVDKWLKINALCPLCKAEVPNSSTGSLDLNLGWHHINRRVGNDIELVNSSSIS